MENHIQNHLDSLYGAGAEQSGTKRTVYQGVVNMLQADLKELQQKAPHIWDQVRRDQRKLAQIVQGAVQRIVPPRAMELINQEHLQNTPMTEGELWGAFRQVDQRTDLAPAQRRELKESIRIDILAAKQRNLRRRPAGR